MGLDYKASLSWWPKYKPSLNSGLIVLIKGRRDIKIYKNRKRYIDYLKSASATEPTFYKLKFWNSSNEGALLYLVSDVRSGMIQKIFQLLAKRKRWHRCGPVDVHLIEFRRHADLGKSKQIGWSNETAFGQPWAVSAQQQKCSLFILSSMQSICCYRFAWKSMFNLSLLLIVLLLSHCLHS